METTVEKKPITKKELKAKRKAERAKRKAEKKKAARNRDPKPNPKNMSFQTKEKAQLSLDKINAKYNKKMIRDKESYKKLSERFGVFDAKLDIHGVVFEIKKLFICKRAELKEICNIINVPKADSKFELVKKIYETTTGIKFDSKEEKIEEKKCEINPEIKSDPKEEKIEINTIKDEIEIPN